MRGKIPDAYNNLARLYIKDDKKKQYAEAAVLLNEGLEFAEEKESDPEVKYSLYKNLGWVRFKQKRNQEAQKNLEAAIKITQNRNDSKHIRNRGSAHCILGQVLEQKKEQQKQPTALEQWQKCCELASPKDADEDTWFYQAQEKVRKAGKK